MQRTLPDTRPYLTRDERDLLAAVSRYCRAAGWRMGGARGLGSFVCPDKTLDVDWWSFHRADSTVLQISALTEWGTPRGSICHAEISSAQEAVDIGVAYGLLPADFSSGFKASGEAMLADVLTPRYTSRIAMRADQIEAVYMDELAPGWQVLDARDETTWHEVLGVADCEDDTCKIRDIIGITCVVLLTDAWAGGAAHLMSDQTVQVRIPAAAL